MTMIGYDNLPLNTAAALASGSTGDKATLTVPPGYWEFVRSYVTWEGASAHATAAVIAFDIASAAGRGDGDAGVIKKTASLDEQYTQTYWEPPATVAGRVFVSGGSQIVVQVTTAQGEALAFAAGVVLKSSPEAQVNLSAENVTAA